MNKANFDILDSEFDIRNYNELPLREKNVKNKQLK
jgi:hypothetical protein